MADKHNLVVVEHLWSILASHVSIDQESKNISLSGVLEQLNLKKSELDAHKTSDGKPVNVAFPLNVVTLLRKVGEGIFAGAMKVEIIDPRGEILGTSENEFAFEQGKDRWRFIIRVPGLPVTEAGYYTFRFSVRSKEGEYEEVGKAVLQVVID